jgi:hypothetical protein
MRLVSAYLKAFGLKNMLTGCISEASFCQNTDLRIVALSMAAAP